MTDTSITYLVAACAGVFGLAAFIWFFALPAASAYSRGRERVAAMFLSLYVLAALVGGGVAIGALIIFYWPDIFG